MAWSDYDDDVGMAVIYGVPGDPETWRRPAMGFGAFGGLGDPFPLAYTPHCLEDGELRLNRNDHLEVWIHLRLWTGAGSRRHSIGVDRVIAYFTPGPSGTWGSGGFARHFHGKNIAASAVISLANFKTWIARQIPVMFRDAYGSSTLIAPGVCVKTIWRGDGTRLVAPPDASSSPPPPAGGSVPPPIYTLLRPRSPGFRFPTPPAPTPPGIPGYGHMPLPGEDVTITPPAPPWRPDWLGRYRPPPPPAADPGPYGPGADGGASSGDTADGATPGETTGEDAPADDAAADGGVVDPGVYEEQSFLDKHGTKLLIGAAVAAGLFAAYKIGKKKNRRRNANVKRTGTVTMRLPSDSSAWDVIAEIYRKLPNKTARDEWHIRTLGKEDNFSAVKAEAKKMGFSLLPGGVRRNRRRNRSR